MLDRVALCTDVRRQDLTVIDVAAVDNLGDIGMTAGTGLSGVDIAGQIYHTAVVDSCRIVVDIAFAELAVWVAVCTRLTFHGYICGHSWAVHDAVAVGSSL